MAIFVKQKEEFSAFAPVKKVSLFEGVRVVHFSLKEGQKVSLHTSPYKVILVVVEGEGEFYASSEENKEVLEKGQVVIYERHEPHGFKALRDMVVVAFILE
ncbi:MAG: cupin domain-containing protein [Aquificota bacterium]|jgi:quercetin dioxygenase-like cupin family protein|nr:MAG: cupin domain-containing protein [Aquificota bacterium]